MGPGRSIEVGFLRVIPFALFALGAVALAWAVRTGQATTGVFLIFPYVSGTSGLVALGVVLLIFGFLTIGLALDPWSTETPVRSARPPSEHPAEDPPRAGGVVLIGPIPIFFGAWRRPAPWAYWLAGVVGLALVLGLAFLALRVGA